MTTVQEIIDRLGTPPREVCLDWAWQLQDFKYQPVRSDHQEPGDISVSLLETRANWSDVSVADNGKLRLHRAEASNTPPRVDDLVAELLGWAAIGPLPPQTEIHPSSCEELLRRHTLELIESSVRPNGLTSNPAAANVVGKEPSMRSAAITTSPSSVRSSRRLKHYYCAAAAIALACAVGVIYSQSVFWDSTIDEPGNNRKAPPNELSTQPASADPSQLVTGEDSLSNTSISLSNSELPESMGSRLPIDGILSESHIANAELESAGAPVLSDSADLDLSSAQVKTAVTDPAVSAQAEKLSSESTVDVLADLAELTKSAEMQPAERQVVRESNSAEGVGERPLLLATFPSSQLQKFEKTLRPREASWSLRLEVSEGFVVVPSDRQFLSGRDIVAWTLYNDHDAKSAVPKSNTKVVRTQVWVQAQLAGNREPALRWRIVAGAEDLPGIAIPLNRKLLDQVQMVFGGRLRVLQSEIERTKGLGRAQGLPSETRSALANHRKMLESQHKLAARLLEITAEANQIEGWLDGQIEVHAELFDAAATPATSLIQFGNPHADSHPQSADAVSTAGTP